MIVLDANILIRAVLGRRVRELIESYARQGVRFLTPDVAFAHVACGRKTPISWNGNRRMDNKSDRDFSQGTGEDS